MLLFLYLFILIFSPLAFGTVEYWSLGTVEALVPATVLLLCLHLQINKDLHLRIPGLLPLVLLLCWIGLQLVPLPPRLVQTIAPKIYEAYLPLLQLYDHPPWISLTVQPKASLQELLRFSTYALFFVLTVQLLSRSDRLQKTVTVVAWLGIAIAIEAIIQKLTSPQAIYWFRPAPPSTSPIGPWVYCNHFAGFMEMIFPLVVALFLFHRPRISYEEPLRDRILAMFTLSGANKHMLFGTGAMLMAVAILLSVSRGGIITLCLALLFFTVYMSRQNGQWRNKWLLVLVTLVLLIISWLGWDPIMHKFGNIWGDQGLNTSIRFPVLLDSINMARDYILTGSGFGTYEVAFPAYRTVPGERIYFDHAHNDYIELLATGGLIGFLLAAWFIVAVIFYVIRMVNRRREQYNILLTTASLTGIFALLLHCFVDFQMYNGANALYFFFLCGLAIAAANTRLQYRTRPTLLSPANRLQGPLTAVLALTVLVSGLWYNSAVFRARRTFAPIRNIYLNRNIPQQQLQTLYRSTGKAVDLDFLEGDYRFGMGNISRTLGLRKRAGQEYLQASTLNPLSGMFIQRLGLNLGPDQKEKAEELMALGCAYEPLIPDRYLTYANWLIAAGNRGRSLTIINQALTRQPQWTSRLSGFLFFNRLNTEEIKTMLPNQPRAWYEIGRIMEKNGKKEEAEYYYLQGLKFLDTQEVRPEYFSRLYNLYRKQKDDDKALAILRSGIEHLPDNATFHKQLGDYYRKQGIVYRATEEYRQALLLNPKDVTLKRRLDDLQKKRSAQSNNQH